MRKKFSDNPRDRYRRKILQERIESQGLDPADYPEIFDPQPKVRTPKLSKSEKKRKYAMQETDRLLQQLTINDIHPMTPTQKAVFGAFEDANGPQNFALVGCSGTGKTFLAIYKALRAVLIDGTHNSVVIVRSTVQVREEGFLPGNRNEKISPFEEPYQAMINGIFQNDRAFDALKAGGYVSIRSTAFVRGITLDDAYVVVDECQSMNFHELFSVITRVGTGSNLIFCGDGAQNDLLRRSDDKSGLSDFLSILEKMDSFEVFRFSIEDVVRSSLVKEFLSTLDTMARNWELPDEIASRYI